MRGVMQRRRGMRHVLVVQAHLSTSYAAHFIRYRLTVYRPQSWWRRLYPVTLNSKIGTLYRLWVPLSLCDAD